MIAPSGGGQPLVIGSRLRAVQCSRMCVWTKASGCQPSLVECARPPVEADSQTYRGILDTSSPDQRLDQCVLEHLALGMGTTDQLQVVFDREQPI